MDAAHIATDKELERIEKKLTEIYSQAAKELGEKADKYFERFKELDQQKRALVKAGKMTEADYKRWRQGKIMTGEHWKEMQKQAAQRLTEADRIAVEYTNGRLPYVYSLNYNSVAEGLETRLNGYSFELVDEATVRNLAMSDKTLLPYKVVDGKKAERWHTARVNAEVTQGILQGESIPKIAKRLKTNVGMTAKGSAVRNARTSVTSAENKGRIDMLHDARKKGVIADKIWMAAHDSRTREAHRLLDGQEQDIDDPFKSIDGDIMFPGDPEARPEMVYNCRCSLTYKVVGFWKEHSNILEDTGIEQQGEQPESEKPEPMIAGVERREPMNHEAADSGNVNPNYGTDPAYGINCQSCVVTYEARRRGYDIEVVPNNAQHPMCGKLASDARLAYRNKDGTQADYAIGNASWTWKGAWKGETPTANRFEKMLNDRLDENGRYTVQFKWQGFNAGHIVTLTKDSNGLIIYDPQSNRTFSGKDLSDYLARMQYKRQYKGNTYYQWPSVMRVDDKDFDFDVVNQVTQRRRP